MEDYPANPMDFKDGDSLDIEEQLLLGRLRRLLAGWRKKPRSRQPSSSSATS